MPGPYIVTWHFNAYAGGSEGWTESWYLESGGNPEDKLALASTYNPFRRAILTSDWYIAAMSISDLKVLGDSAYREFYPNQTRGLYPVIPSIGATEQSEPPHVSLYLRAEAGTTRRRAIPMRGIPTGQGDRSGQYTPTDPFRTAFKFFSDFFDPLKASPLRLRKRQRGTAVPCSVAESLVYPGALVATFTPPLPAAVAGEPFQISGIRQQIAFGYNGNWFERSRDTTTITSFAKRKHYFLGSPLGALYYPITTTYETISAVIPQFVRSRKTGRPFGGSRGRVSAIRH